MTKAKVDLVEQLSTPNGKSKKKPIVICTRCGQCLFPELAKMFGANYMCYECWKLQTQAVMIERAFKIAKEQLEQLEHNWYLKISNPIDQTVTPGKLEYEPHLTIIFNLKSKEIETFSIDTGNRVIMFDETEK